MNTSPHARNNTPRSLPVLSCAAVAAFEKEFFFRTNGTAVRETEFLRRAAAGVAAETAMLFAEIRRRPLRKILVAAGIGNNAADALLAAHHLARRASNFYGNKRNDGRADCSDVHVLLAEASLDRLNRAARAAFNELEERGAKISSPETWSQNEFWETLNSASATPFDLLLDGILGYGFRPPLRENHATLIRRLNSRADALLRIAVDLPSGIGDEPFPQKNNADAGGSSDENTGNVAFRADATIACGFVKTPLLRPENAPFCGRIRLVDIGFPRDTSEPNTTHDTTETVHVRAASAEMLLSRSLLTRPRPASADKRHFGHLFVLGGERKMPGALLMNVRAALHAGCGLVTAFCAESVHAAFAAAAPEAMWIPWTETPDGTLALEDEHLLRDRLPRASALLCGSGMGLDAETRVLLQSIVERAAKAGISIILDAGALQPEIVEAAKCATKSDGTPNANTSANAPVILLPHAGEFARISAAKCPAATVALKGAPTRIRSVKTTVNTYTEETVICAGGPILARGGSGDILAGITGALFARNDSSSRPPVDVLADAVAWHSLAADHAARHLGTESASALALLPFLNFPCE